MSPLRKPLILEKDQNRCDTLLKNSTEFSQSDIKCGQNSTERSMFSNILKDKIFTNTFRSGLIY